MKNGNCANVRLLRDNEYWDALIHAVDSAGHDIVMVYYLFKTNGYGSNLPDKIVGHLEMAVRRGVEVRVVMERSSNIDSDLDRSNEATAMRLQRAGVTVIRDDPGVRTHVKAAVIDGRYVFLGSHNLTNSALKYNHELSLVVESPFTANETLRYINELR